MISWIVIVILLIVGIFAIKLNHLRHRVFIILLVVLALFLYITMFFVNSQNNIELTSTEGVFNALKLYAGWLANGFENVKIIVGNAIGMDWTSTEGSFFNKTKTDNKK